MKGITEFYKYSPIKDISTLDVDTQMNIICVHFQGYFHERFTKYKLMVMIENHFKISTACKDVIKSFYAQFKEQKITFKYKMRTRPCDIGCQPDDFINYEEFDKKETGFWGELTYDRELTEQEIYKFELFKVEEQK